MRDRTGRTAPFDEIVRANEHDLLAYFQRRTLNGADAADAFGELLLIAWKRRSKIPTEAVAARMWLFVAAHHVLQNHRRAKARSSEALQRLADTMRTFVPEFSSDEDIIMLRDAINRLAPDDAELVRLIYWDGFRSAEAAAILGLNPSTARSRLAKVMHLLRASRRTGFPTRSSRHDSSSPQRRTRSITTSTAHHPGLMEACS